MGEIRVPKLNNNDSEYTLLEWLAADGAEVRRDDALASVETSKAVEELVSEHDGMLTHVVRAGATCAPGQVIAHIAAAHAAPQPTEPPTTEPPTTEPPATEPPATEPPATEPRTAGSSDGPVITAPAQALLDELGLDPALVRALPLKVVRRTDVERLATGSSGGTRPLSPHQRAVARTVTLSHRTIPAAYTAIKVDVTPALATARALTRRLRRLVGLPDLLIAAVARQHEAFPVFFAELVDDTTARLPDAPRVGVTIDMGEGLYVPVIRDRLTVADIAERLAGFRALAQRGGFREEHLAGANIVVTLHHDADIVMAVPIIHPGNACALALTSPQPEADRTVAVIGLAYDHRLINGREVVLFLQALKETLETASESL
ncbi:2-oxo acid dehydrogenase subunit E2 [Nonomuraea rhizosphaerae]|uniref:2-oxo acid dehydrogenase subunit E2 n=1 Tax=Nonomuraea rhizosphaerae TaxID=2665663 RepID=UPI001C5E96BB|nr:2-oxo acid dehydrogenase subunit E2 [Nonomuraea rhizosphaerae]